MIWLGLGMVILLVLGESIRGRLDKASAYSEMYADRLDNQMDDVLGKTEIEIQLEERKRRLGLSEPATTSQVAADEEEESAASS